MRTTIATVAALFMGCALASNHLKITSPKESFSHQSTNLHTQPHVANILMLVGFVLFGLAYLYTVAMIFIDTANRDSETQVLLENDL